MTAYIVRRLLATMPVMAVVALFVFFLLRLAPGDPAAIIAGEDATAEPIAAVRAKLGLDRPMVEQFVVWLCGTAAGRFRHLDLLQPAGDAADRPAPRADRGADAVDAVRRRVRSPSRIGVLAAWKARKLVDRLVMGFAVLGFAMPVFVLAYVLIYFFAVQWRLAAGAGLPADRARASGRWPRA